MPADPRALRWNAIDPAPLWAPLSDRLPAPPARILDIGAGSARDAEWFGDLGHSVSCVEPDIGLWPDGLDWIASRLPGLVGVAERYDLITITAVWHLVPQTHWFAGFKRLAELAMPQGRLILSLRCPPLAGAAAVFATARAAGWKREHRVCRPSAQPGNCRAGVLWDWCVLTRVAPG